MTPSIKWKILLIDDEPDIRDVISVTLEDSDYSVVCAADGHTGLMLAAREKPQIVITDIKMPGMSGLEVLEKIKKISPETEVIVTTGFGDMKKAIRALQCDASDFISKPIDDDALHMALKRAKQRYVDKKQLSDYTRLLENKVVHQAKELHREKMVSLGRLAASIVHEINNPLAGILNYIKLMQHVLTKHTSQVSTGLEKFDSYLVLIESETRRCSDLVSGLLKFSRKTELERKSIDVASLVRHSLLLCRHKLEICNIAVKERCDISVPNVYGDFNQLEQCIINLIFNAIDAIGAMTPVDKKESKDSIQSLLEIKTAYSTEKNLVYISVKDNGKGISAQDLNFIFEPFFTTKSEGAGVGLGLSVAYGIIENHQGIIEVKSQLNRGTEFIIKLPLDTSNAQKQNSEYTKTDGGLHGNG